MLTDTTTDQARLMVTLGLALDAAERLAGDQDADRAAWLLRLLLSAAEDVSPDFLRLRKLRHRIGRRLDRLWANL